MHYTQYLQLYRLDHVVDNLMIHDQVGFQLICRQMLDRIIDVNLELESLDQRKKYLAI